MKENLKNSWKDLSTNRNDLQNKPLKSTEGFRLQGRETEVEMAIMSVLYRYKRPMATAEVTEKVNSLVAHVLLRVVEEMGPDKGQEFISQTKRREVDSRVKRAFEDFANGIWSPGRTTSPQLTAIPA